MVPSKYIKDLYKFNLDLEVQCQWKVEVEMSTAEIVNRTPLIKDLKMLTATHHLTQNLMEVPAKLYVLTLIESIMKFCKV
jgi:hypothetical protein